MLLIASHADSTDAWTIKCLKNSLLTVPSVLRVLLKVYFKVLPKRRVESGL